MEQNQALTEKTFSYKIVEQNNVCVLAFNGYLSKRCEAVVQECLNSIKSSKCLIYIFDFQNVAYIEKSSHRFLFQVQKEIKSKEGAELKLCSLNTSSKSDLLEAGIIRHNDVFKSAKYVLHRMTMR